MVKIISLCFFALVLHEITSPSKRLKKRKDKNSGKKEYIVPHVSSEEENLELMEELPMFSKKPISESQDLESLAENKEKKYAFDRLGEAIFILYENYAPKWDEIEHRRKDFEEGYKNLENFFLGRAHSVQQRDDIKKEQHILRELRRKELEDKISTTKMEISKKLSDEISKYAKNIWNAINFYIKKSNITTPPTFKSEEEIAREIDREIRLRYIKNKDDQRYNISKFMKELESYAPIYSKDDIYKKKNLNSFLASIINEVLLNMKLNQHIGATFMSDFYCGTKRYKSIYADQCRTFLSSIPFIGHHRWVHLYRKVKQNLK